MTAALQDLFPIKSLIFAKQIISALFSSGVDTLSCGIKNRIVRLPIGARIGVIWDHLFQERESGIIPVISGNKRS